jgi:aspartyl-tRNA(Asn)/glutamyl-tRNA(Gln) amidotransferase subunit B
MRCDVNISLRESGCETLGTRTEIKNLNSFTSVAAAIEYEYSRQAELLDSSRPVIQETRGWDADAGETVGQRGKEDANDYRYFPEPDVCEIYISDGEVALLRDEIPELPDVKLGRYINELGIPPSDAKLLTKYAAVSDYFETACAGGSAPKMVASLMVTQMFGRITTEIERENWSPKTTARQLGELALMIGDGKLSHNLAKRVFTQMLESGGDAASFISEDDLKGFSSDTLAELCYNVIEQNPKTVSDYRAGKDKAIMALVGAVMRETKGRADAAAAEETLRKLMNG